METQRLCLLREAEDGGTVLLSCNIGQPELPLSLRSESSRRGLCTQRCCVSLAGDEDDALYSELEAEGDGSLAGHLRHRSR